MFEAGLLLVILALLLRLEMLMFVLDASLGTGWMAKRVMCKQTPHDLDGELLWNLRYPYVAGGTLWSVCTSTGRLAVLQPHWWIYILLAHIITALELKFRAVRSSTSGL
mgnify:CR=1 FL=1